MTRLPTLTALGVLTLLAVTGCSESNISFPDRTPAPSAQPTPSPVATATPTATPTPTPTQQVGTTSQVLTLSRSRSDVDEPFAVNGGAFGFNDTTETGSPIPVNQ